MCIATRCTSIDQFVDMFHRFVDEDSFFVSTVNTRPPGLETSFSVQLADGTPVLRGLCVVLQSWTTATSPFKTPGVRLGIKRLTANSMPVFERLLLTRSKPTQAPPPPHSALAAGTALPRSQGTIEIEAPKFSDTLPTKVAVRTPPLETALKSEPVIIKADAPTPDLDRPDVVAKPDPNDADQRTPGSELVLPANPLQHLTDESLEGYVDCTLYEETGTFFPVDDDGTLIDELVPPPAPAMLAPRPVGRLQPPVEIVAEPAETDEPDLIFDPPRSVEVVERRDATPVPPMPQPQRASVPVIVNAARESTPAGEITEPTRPSTKRGWLLAGVLLSAAAGVALWQVREASDAANASPTDPTPKAQVVTPPPADEVVIDKPADEPAVAPDPPPTDHVATPDQEPETGAMPTAGEGPCRVVVASTPAGSSVVLDGKVIAPSPVTIATTCDRHKIDIRHPRYQLASKFVVLKEDAPGKVEVTMQRPTHSVSVLSTPPGATVFINGNRAGTTPTKLSVLGFSNLQLELKKPGYATVTQKLYSKVAEDKVIVKLTKW